MRQKAVVACLEELKKHSREKKLYDSFIAKAKKSDFDHQSPEEVVFFLYQVYAENHPIILTHDAAQQLANLCVDSEHRKNTKLTKAPKKSIASRGRGQ